VAGYLRRLARERLLDVTGTTSNRRYAAHPLISVDFTVRLTAGLSEDAIWRERLLPHIRPQLLENIINICEYGFTEMLNNAIDHSASFSAHIFYRQTYSDINIRVVDQGIGIFLKI
jgi:hypothetical protein